jgi:hypothetical protein
MSYVYNISFPNGPGKITGKYAYFDHVQFWVVKPLDDETFDLLRKQCGGLHRDNLPARFNPLYRQRLNMFQPRELALRWLTERDHVLINRVEVTIDYVIEGMPREDVWEFLHRHLVRRWHGRKQNIRVKTADENRRTGTRYDALQWVANKTAFYCEDHSRITGELNCLHFEWHLNGLNSVRNAGIRSGLDMLEFDHHEFWRKRLLLYDVDRERLGRLLRNQASGKRSQTVKMEVWRNKSFTYVVNPDARLGDTYVRSYDTIQELVDSLKSSHRIRSHRLRPALIPISNEFLLPDQPPSL